MGENDLAYAIALQSYARTLLELLRVCSGLKKMDVAKICGVTNPLISHWLTGVRPMAPVHEHALRRLLMEAVNEKRGALKAMGEGDLHRLRDALVKALVDLDGAWLAMALEYAKSVREMAAEATALLEDMRAEACTPSVVEGVHAAYMSAHASHTALPGLWTAIKARNRGLRALLAHRPDVRAHVAALLDYAEKIYGLEEKETPDSRAPAHRRRGRPRKAARTETRQTTKAARKKRVTV